MNGMNMIQSMKGVSGEVLWISSRGMALYDSRTNMGRISTGFEKL